VGTRGRRGHRPQRKIRALRVGRPDRRHLPLGVAAGEFFAARGTESFHPEIPVVFAAADAEQNYHVPLLLSPFSYTTYRGY
jgi:5-hydroxyisourate hydrolase-like protein (transthyretin family)